MKKSYLLAVLLFPVLFVNTLNSQSVYKFRAKYLALCDWNKYSDSWSDWRDEKECNILIVIDMDELRISVYASETATLDIYNYEKSNDFSQNSLKMYAVDNYGSKCVATFIYYENEDERQLYITYPGDFGVVYGIRPVGNN